MNNKQNNVNRGLLDTQRNDVNNQYSEFLKGAGGRLNTSYGNADSLRNEIQNRYTNNNNFMPSGMTPNSSGWFNLPDEGPVGYAAGGDYSGAKAGFNKFAETGGVNRGDFDESIGSFRNFISNGGLGEGEANALRARATAAVPSFYNNYKQSLQRRANTQGGYSPGFDAQMAEIGRQAGREGFNASRQVEGDIAEKTIQGRQFGTSGLAQLMSAITGMEQSGKLAGLSGLKGIGDSEQSNSQFNAGLGESRRARNQGAQLDLARMYQSGGQANASGLQSLRNSQDGDVGQGLQAWLSGQNAASGNSLQNIMARLGIKDRSWIDLLPQLLGGASGIVSGFAGGPK